MFKNKSIPAYQNMIRWNQRKGLVLIVANSPQLKFVILIYFIKIINHIEFYMPYCKFAR